MALSVATVLPHLQAKLRKAAEKKIYTHFNRQLDTILEKRKTLRQMLKLDFTLRMASFLSSEVPSMGPFSLALSVTLS